MSVLDRLSPANYAAYLKRINEYLESHARNSNPYWDATTGSCGSHLSFTLDAFSIQGSTRGYSSKDVMKPSDVASVLDALDAGCVIECGHDYRRAIYFDLPKDNRYGNHVFALFKVGSRYYWSQGYLHRYRTSIVAHSRAETGARLSRIMADLCDYDDVKTWADLDFDAYKAIFMTHLSMYPDRPAKPDRRVHGLVLYYKTWNNNNKILNRQKTPKNG